MSTEPSPSHTRELSNSSGTLTNHPSPASSGYFDPTPNANPQRTRLALVVCYSDAGQLPQYFWLEPKDGLVSFMDGREFLEATHFIERPYAIYDSMLGDFVDLPPLSEWRHPSRKYSYFLLKEGTLREDQCPEIIDWIKGLDEDIMEFLDFYPVPDARFDSPLPSSSPPPPPTQHVDKGIQAPEYRKRKLSNVETDQAGSSREHGINVNLNVILHDAKDSNRLVKRARRNKKTATVFHGSGTANDPFVLRD